MVRVAVFKFWQLVPTVIYNRKYQWKVNCKSSFEANTTEVKSEMETKIDITTEQLVLKYIVTR